MLAAISLLLLTGLCVGVGKLLTMGLGPEVQLPVLAITWVVVLLGVLALTAVGFSMVNLADRTEALGLPPGLVRGVIALSPVVLFAILSVFLFGALNEGMTCRLPPVSRRRNAIKFPVPSALDLALAPFRAIRPSRARTTLRQG